MEPLPTGFYPFWFWNDTITPDGINWQVAQMAAQGMRGFFIHSRQGLKDPAYLSEAFLDRVCTAVAAARQHGLVVHLYDEYPYPSGAAGGLVTQGEPEFLATELIQSTHEVPGGPLRLELLPGKVLSLLAFPVSPAHIDWDHPLDLSAAVGMVLDEDDYQETGLTRYNQKRYFANRPRPVLQATLPPGQWRIISSQQRVVEGHKYWKNFSDVLNPAAVSRFMELTHERYNRRLGDQFGQTVRWIFTDEVVPGWSARLPEAYRAEYGRDLLPLLPALHDPAHPLHLQLSLELHRLKLKLFEKVFEEPRSIWCRANGLAYAAEKPSLRFSQLRYQDIPGCEPGHVKAGGVLDLLQPSLRGNARATASAAYFYGKDGALDECYHSLGWSATLEDIRWMADAQLLLGIRYLVPHGFFYSTHNLRKHDAPPSLFFQAPYWPLFGRLSQRVEQIGRAFEGTYIDARLAVVDPTAGLPSSADQAAYACLLQALMGAHLDFHIVDTDVLAAGKLAAGQVRLRDLAVCTVLMPPMAALEPELLAWLEQFRLAGGQVVMCPANFEPAALLAELNRSVQPSLSLVTDGLENTALWAVQRRAAGRALWFVLNTSAQTQTVDMEAINLLREIPLLPVQTPALQTQSGRSRRTFQPFEACLLEAAVPGQPDLRPRPALVTLALAGPLAVHPLAANLARLGAWQMELLDEDGRSLQSASQMPAVPLANQLEIGQFRFAPRIERAFGTPPELAYPRLRVRYTCHFDNRYAGPVELVMEPGSIGGEWTLRLNDSPPLGPADFSATTTHVKGSLGLPLAVWLHPGHNTLTCELVCARPDGGLLNPLYLAGDFGVELHPLCLTNRAATGLFENYPANGLPFYAGVVEYRGSFELDVLPQTERVLLRLEPPGDFHEACQLAINGGPPQALPWGPYQLELDTCELRAGSNTFCLQVYTTLIRAFEGQEFDHRLHHYVSIE